MRRVPTVVIAAERSGIGKTTWSVALTAALRRAGLRVQTFKTGPDFLDPKWLAAASGRPCYNLDPWMCPESYVRSLFFFATRDADMALIEGAMGLFDCARGTRGAGSAAHVAALLGVPVLLVCQAAGTGQSIAAIAAGFSAFRDDVRVAGVIANRCASASHRALLAQALQDRGLPPLVAASPDAEPPSLRSRHLGVVPPERDRGDWDRWAAWIPQADVERMAACAAPPTCPGEPPPWWTRAERVCGPVAVAYDDAFSFYYADLLDALDALSGAVHRFSPLRDEPAPPSAAVLLGGGYPELHAGALAAAHRTADSLRRAVAAGSFLYAECGGLLSLCRTLTVEGTAHPLWGILDADAVMERRRQRLGYVCTQVRRPCVLGPAGTALRGHEFHYGRVAAPDRVPRVLHRATADGAVLEPEGYAPTPGVLASFVHHHLASRPQVLMHLLDGGRQPAGGSS